jgi:GTPase
MRQVNIPGFDKAILSDTVGFVSNLPTELVAAFRATLEEVSAADLILHVRDIAHPDSEAQAADVETVLASLGLAEEGSPRRLEVWNKLDLLPAAERRELLGEAARREDVVALSALTGEGVDDLRETISRLLHAGSQTHQVRLNAGDGERIAWLHARGEVLEQHSDGDQLQLSVKLSPENWARFERL